MSNYTFRRPAAGLDWAQLASYAKAQIDPRSGAAGQGQTAPGTVQGTNGLFRLNYFNGRSLTAEALRAEEIYWDTRARLLAQIAPQGIAWGLGLEAGVVWSAPSDDCPSTFNPVEGKLTSGTTLKLQPGLAFDNAGRPIVVGAEFPFQLKSLMDQFISNQTVVVDGGTQFAPCVCLAPAPPGVTGKGPSLSPGPYLLIIKPQETPEGEAKLHGSACPSGGTMLCEADGWRGGFSLALTRFPVNVAMDSVCSAWDLRGVLSSYYFDVYEHALSQRWKDPFPRGNGVDFCDGLGPLDHAEGAVPLAMLYVGNDGSILFLDSWIPRRPTASTASSAWAANVRGAPTSAACIARVHQFQCMLDESLTSAPFVPLQREQIGRVGIWRRAAFRELAKIYGKNASVAPLYNTLDLYSRGFRHIPPWGFLPVPKLPADPRTEVAPTDATQIRYADLIARSYFFGTNVIAYTVVAIHDDDILEDMIQAMEKDPILLRRCPDVRREDLNADELKRDDSTHFKAARINTVPGLASQVLIELLSRGGLTMDALINREIEIVKLVIPMRGLRRNDPVVGAVQAADEGIRIRAWARIAESMGSNASSRMRAMAEAFLGPASEVEQFVFYVKQRLVLLDWLYLVIEHLLGVIATASEVLQKRAVPAGDKGVGMGIVANTFRPARLRDKQYLTLNTGMLRAVGSSMPTKLPYTLASLFANDTTRTLALAAIKVVAPGTADAAKWRRFEVLQIALRRRLAEKEPDTTPDEIAVLAHDQAVDSMLNLYPDFAVVKAATALLPADEAMEFESALQGSAPTAPASDSMGERAAAAAPVMKGERAGSIYTAAHGAYAERDLMEIAPEAAPDGGAVGELLVASPAELSMIMGSAEGAKKVVDKVTSDTHALAAAANALSTAAPEVWIAYETALKRTGTPIKAMAELASEKDRVHKHAAIELERLHALVGDKGVAAVVEVLKKKP